MERGSTTVVLGANGVGKTTMLHLALGWLVPQKGEILLNDRPLTELNQRERGRLMSLVPQKEHLPFDYSLPEYVLLGRTPYLKPLGQPKQADIDIASGALSRVGLDPYDTRPIPNLSGGERQLLLIARSLTQQPQILLLDEPTSHLDLRNKRLVVELIRGLVEEHGLTAIVTTHEPDVALALGRYGVLMHEGRVLRYGEMEEVFTGDLLSMTYDADIAVDRVGGRKVVRWL
jgi:iron complex transport system ATP-binding protein